jgi:hypothetical protein
MTFDLAYAVFNSRPRRRSMQISQDSGDLQAWFTSSSSPPTSWLSSSLLAHLVSLSLVSTALSLCITSAPSSVPIAFDDPLCSCFAVPRVKTAVYWLHHFPRCFGTRFRVFQLRTWLVRGNSTAILLGHGELYRPDLYACRAAPLSMLYRPGRGGFGCECFAHGGYRELVRRAATERIRCRSC